MKNFISQRVILFFVLLLFSLNITAQKKMVLVEGFLEYNVMDFHKIAVDDSITYNTIDKFVSLMEKNPIEYEDAIRKTTVIKSVKKDRYNVSEFKDGILYLNDRLNDMPYTKHVVILQHFAIMNGMETKEGRLAGIYNRNFSITDDNEYNFRKQIRSKIIYDYIVKKLINKSPLRSKK